LLAGSVVRDAQHRLRVLVDSAAGAVEPERACGGVTDERFEVPDMRVQFFAQCDAQVGRQIRASLDADGARHPPQIRPR
jgi:hypothetical protein